MSRTFVPFDDSYRVPVAVSVSRGVVCGHRLFVCGQMDLDADGKPRHLGDLWAQTESAMRLLYDVVAHAAFDPRDLLHLHIFYLGDPSEEAAYRCKLNKAFPECDQALLVLTPVVSFPMQGAEVEIDAIAISTGEQMSTTGVDGVLSGARRGEWITAQAIASGDCDLSAQLRTMLETIPDTLDSLGADAADTMKLNLYFDPSLSSAEIESAEQQVARSFASSKPVYHPMVLPCSLPNGERLRLELLALRDADNKTAQRTTVRNDVDGLPYASAIRSGDVVFIGARFPYDERGHLQHPLDLSGQTHRVMAEMKRALASVDAGLRHITKVNSYFLGEHDQKSWATNVGIRSGYYVMPGPASTGIEVKRLVREGAMIAADCIAVID